MSEYFHLQPTILTAYYATRRRIKNILGIADKPKTDVLSGGKDHAVKRYTRICQTLLDNLPQSNKIQNGVVGEIGCGDCLAAADMMLGLGAQHVHLVDTIPMIVSSQHKDALHEVVNSGKFPNQGKVLADENTPKLNQQFVTFHQGLLENIKINDKIDFLYSFDVLEHVEDLDGFFSYCSELVKPGGIMMHKFDLSGHGYFEDPMPPLDFQTLPDWLFDFVFAKYDRAVGHFADQFYDAMKKHGFTNLKVIPIRTAEEDYLNKVYPRLRKSARMRDKQTLSLLDLIVISEKI